jgi:hypothetical protein
MKRGGGDASLLHQVNKGVLFGSKLSTMHVTPHQTVFMKYFKRLTILFCAFTIGKGIDIIKKTNSRSKEIIRVANFDKVGIVEEKQNRG